MVKAVGRWRAARRARKEAEAASTAIRIDAKNIDDFLEQYNQFSGELIGRLGYAPLDDEERKNHYERIARLERAIYNIVDYAFFNPEFLIPIGLQIEGDTVSLPSVEDLLKEASEYLNHVGSPYNRYVAPWKDSSDTYFKDSSECFRDRLDKYFSARTALEDAKKSA